MADVKKEMFLDADGDPVLVERHKGFKVTDKRAYLDKALAKADKEYALKKATEALEHELEKKKPTPNWVLERNRMPWADAPTRANNPGAKFDQPPPSLPIDREVVHELFGSDVQYRPEIESITEKRFAAINAAKQEQSFLDRVKRKAKELKAARWIV